MNCVYFFQLLLFEYGTYGDMKTTGSRQQLGEKILVE